MYSGKSVKVLLLSFALLFTAGCSSGSAVDIEETSPVTEQVEVKEKKNFSFSEKVPVEGFVEKHDQIRTKLVEDSFKRGGSFALSIYPMDSGMMLLEKLDEYYTKRYDDSQIRSDFLSTKAPFGKNISFFLSLQHVGGYNNSDSISLDESTYEFFFLENENGDFIRANSQQLGMFDSEVSWISDSVQMVVFFDEDEIKELMTGANELYMTFEGLDIFDENRFQLRYPFDQYYMDDFPEIKTMIQEMER